MVTETIIKISKFIERVKAGITIKALGVTIKISQVSVNQQISSRQDLWVV